MRVGLSLQVGIPSGSGVRVQFRFFHRPPPLVGLGRLDSRVVAVPTLAVQFFDTSCLCRQVVAICVAFSPFFLQSHDEQNGCDRLNSGESPVSNLQRLEPRLELKTAAHLWVSPLVTSLAANSASCLVEDTASC